MASPPAYVNPDVMRWARESMGYSLEEAAHKIRVSPDKLEAAERGDVQLTLRQAEKAAKAYERAFADLFRPEPPEEETLEAQFRRLPGAPGLPWPPAMRALARRVRGRQEAAAELYELIDEQPAWPGLRLPTARDPNAAADAMRDMLGIPVDEQREWQDPQGYKPLRDWVDAVERLGVLVMQDGSLPMHVMRGFASTDERTPAVVVNTRDDPRARAFTVIHELGHLLPASPAHGAHGEVWCNRFAAQLLMPAEPFLSSVEASTLDGRRDDPLRAIDRLARDWGVTPLAATIRARSLDAISEALAGNLRRRIAQRPHRRPTGGGNHYRTMLSRLGPSFAGLVFEALETQAVTYPTASALLGVKVNHLGKFREQVDERSYA